MGFKKKKTRDFVGFLPDKAGGGINCLEEVDNPLVERAILDGEEGEGGTKEDGEDDEGPFNNKNQVTGEKEVSQKQTKSELEKLLERHVAHEAKLVLSDVLRDGVLLHSTSLSASRRISESAIQYFILDS